MVNELEQVKSDIKDIEKRIIVLEKKTSNGIFRKLTKAIAELQESVINLSNVSQRLEVRINTEYGSILSVMTDINKEIKNYSERQLVLLGIIEKMKEIPCVRDKFSE